VELVCTALPSTVKPLSGRSALFAVELLPEGTVSRGEACRFKSSNHLIFSKYTQVVPLGEIVDLVTIGNEVMKRTCLAMNFCGQSGCSLLPFSSASPNLGKPIRSKATKQNSKAGLLEMVVTCQAVGDREHSAKR
jgi:hypothetical protein